MAGRANTKMKARRAGRFANDKDKSEDDYDMSHLQKPFISNMNNLKKIIKLHQNTTPEIKGLLENECDILLECRVCRNIFRSLLNFLLHKRSFCSEKFNHALLEWPREDDDYLEIFYKETEKSYDNNKKDDKIPQKSLNSIIEKLTQKKQFGMQMENFSLSEFYKRNDNAYGLHLEKDKKLEVEPIEGSDIMYQTLVSAGDASTATDAKKLEILELHNMTEGQTAVLGPDGKVVSINQTIVSCSPTSDMKMDLTCKKCNIEFATQKTLTSHIKYKHETSRTVYPCLECSDSFATVWSVYRHLYNVHRKTVPEVRKMRSKLQAKAYKVEEDDELNAKVTDSDSMDSQQKLDEENLQWMENFESDNDIQMCGGCGRRFERKAALNSHSQTCQKRIAARNLIINNKQKRIAAAEDKLSSEKQRNIRPAKSEFESEKRPLDMDKYNVAKKRKIGIQIRYDYSKPALDKIGTSIPNSKPYVDNSSDDQVKDLLELCNNIKDSVEPTEKQTSATENLCSAVFNLRSKDIENTIDLIDSEIVSIPSSNSSPCKDEDDPLSLKDVNDDQDSEIEEIFDSIAKPVYDDISLAERIDTRIHEIIGSNNPVKLPNIHDATTLSIIKLVNSDMSDEAEKPTLDDKIMTYIHVKKLQCIPCDIKFSNMSKLRNHMSSHFNWMRFRCDICAFKAYDKFEVFDHIKQSHNIMDPEKIEVVILQIPDWETVELSSKDFIPFKPKCEMLDSFSNSFITSDIKIQNIPNDPNSCIIIETSDSVTTNTPQTQPKPLKKKCTKVYKPRKKNSQDSAKKDPLSDSNMDSTGTSNESSPVAESTSSQELKKMVYEVIFGGEDPSVSKSASSNHSSEEKDNMHSIASSDVSNVISRPVRNRVKPINKDFIYDLHEFKETPKTVLVSTYNRDHIKLASNNISDPLEDLTVKKISKKRTTNKYEKTFTKSSLEHMDNTLKKLNLQKRSVDNFDSTDSEGQVGHEEFSHSKVTIVDPKTFLNESDGEDDDIYIVENEELVAVK